MNTAIGVLALQGAFQKHLTMLSALGYPARPVREADELPGLAGIVLPGGESTTIGMLMERRGLDLALREAINDGLPVFGTCAGAILLARDIKDSTQLRLGTLDVAILRNAYGSQVDSFEARLELNDPTYGLAAEIDGIFIRAPRFESLGPEVAVLASFGGHPVLVRQGCQLAATFHPELGTDGAVHRHFAEALCGLRPSGSGSSRPG